MHKDHPLARGGPQIWFWAAESQVRSTSMVRLTGHITFSSWSTLFLRSHQVHWTPKVSVAVRQAGDSNLLVKWTETYPRAPPQRFWLPGSQRASGTCILKASPFWLAEDPLMTHPSSTDDRGLKIIDHPRLHSLSEGRLELWSPESFWALCHLGNCRLLTAALRHFVWELIWPVLTVVDFASF